jgi:large subunit ribosomal protein L36e
MSALPRLQKTTARVSKPRVSRTKGHLSKRTAFVRDLVKEVAGYVY